MARDIVLWVPGTSTHRVHPSFDAAMRAAGQNVKLVNYEASWSFSTSVPDGLARLYAALVEAHRRRKPGQRILIAGESQGALLISHALANPFFAAMIDKAALLGHPGVSPIHFHEPNPKVLEINHRWDPTTFRWSSDQTKVLLSVDKMVTHHDLSTIPFFISLLFRNPVEALMAGWVSLRSLSWLKWAAPDVHNYSGDMQAAAGWLLTKVDTLAKLEVHNAHG